MKKLFAILMIVMMVVCFMPTMAFGVNLPDEMEPGTVRATKTVSGPNENGNYTIHLSVQGKNVVETTGSNADVVLVVDNSGSMSSSVGTPCDASVFEPNGSHDFLLVIRKDYICKKCGATYFEIVGKLSGNTLYTDVPEICTGEVGETVRINAAKDVSEEFAQGILKDRKGNKMALIGFSHGDEDGGANDSDAIKVKVELTNELSALNNAIDKMKANGGTNYSAALEDAYNILISRQDTSRPGYVIFISDGAPGYSGESLSDEDWNGSEQIDKLKKAGITVFTVGIALEDGPADYLKGMATEPEQEHFINVKGTDYAKQLSDILKLWAEQINSKPAGTNAVMEDIVDIDKFAVVGHSAGIKPYSDGNDGKYVWEIGNITEDVKTQTIEIKPLVSGNGIYTNKDVNLKYDDPTGVETTITKDQIGDPKVNVAKVTFKVENGTWDGSDAKDKTVLVPLSVTESKGTLKSAPTGMVANAGYESGSWNPGPNTENGGITEDVTYTYTFTKEEQPPIPSTATVTFKVVNGTWKNGTTADIQKTITLKDGKGTLAATDVPDLMIAKEGYEGGAWDKTPNTEIDGITGDVTYTYTFTERVPVETKATVTFKVVNGTWKNGTTADIQKTITLKDGKGTLAATDVPDLMIAKEGYEGGAWDKTPNTEIDGITGDVTYTYTFTERVPVETKATVTFKVVNGTWKNGTTADIQKTITLKDGKGTLAATDVPDLMIAKEGYEGGAWDKTPNTEIDGITGDVTYTYTFTERVPVETKATVTFKVVNGTWKNGTTADIQKTITLKDGKGTLAATDVPDLMKANAGYEGGAWDKTPNTEIDGITGDVTYTYTFTKKEQPPIPPTHYYTVKWNNYDNTNLETDYCTYYQMPTYDSTTPVRPADEKYTYEFIGWDKEVVRVTGDTVYTAQFKAVAKEQPKPEEPEDPTDKPQKPLPDDKHLTDEETGTEVPKTGDAGMEALALNLLLLSVSAMAGTVLYLRRRTAKR